MFDNKWQKKEMPLVSLIGMGGGIASPAFLASIVLNILKPTVFSPADDTGVPDFDYTAESSAITNVDIVTGPGTGSAETFEGRTNGADYISAAFDSNSNRVVLFYRQPDYSNSTYHGTAVVGEISGGSVTFGSPVIFDTYDTSAGAVVTAAAFDSTNNKVVVAYRKYTDIGGGGSTKYHEAKVGTVDPSNNSITFGAAEVINSNGESSDVSMAFDPSSGKIVVAYRDEGNDHYGTAKVGTITGTSISFGSANVFYDGGQTVSTALVADTSNNRIVLACQDGGIVNVRVGQVSGTSITFGSATAIYSNRSDGGISIAFDASTNKVVVVRTNQSNLSDPYRVYAHVITVDPSNNSISFGSGQQVAAKGYLGQFGIAYDSGSQKLIIMYKNGNSSWQLEYLHATVNGSNNTIAFSSATVLDTNNNNYYGVIHDSNANQSLIFYQHDVSKYGTAHVVGLTGFPDPSAPTTLTLTDTTVSKVSDGSLVEGVSIDEVLTVGETVQADTAVASTVTVPVFSATLYVGNGTSQTVNTGIDLSGEGGMVWIKRRSGSTDHNINDTVRGAGKQLASNQNYAEVTNTNNFAAFTSDGFTVGTGSQTNAANPPETHVAWTFRKAPGFFDVVSWSGNSVNGRQISHSLGSVPGMILLKNLTNTANWEVWHNTFDADDYMGLNSNSPKYETSGPWNNTLPTSEHFTVSSDMDVNRTGDDYVAYLFADTPGLIKCGSYTGNGSTDGPFVYTGFKPAFVMVRSTSGPRQWVMLDNARFPENGPNMPTLYANASTAETTNSENYGDFLSNGFKPRATNGNWNGSGEEYIYMAIAEDAESDITSDIYASGTVSASSGNTITLSNTTGTWSTGMKVQGTDSDTKDNPDPILAENVSLTSSAPTAARNVNTWGDAIWEIATDENFTQNVQTATTALSATGIQAGPSFTLEANTGYYTRTKYTALGQESEWSDVTYFVTGQVDFLTDSYANNLYLALPLTNYKSSLTGGPYADVSSQIKGSGSAKVATSTGSTSISSEVASPFTQYTDSLLFRSTTTTSDLFYYSLQLGSNQALTVELWIYPSSSVSSAHAYIQTNNFGGGYYPAWVWGSNHADKSKLNYFSNPSGHSTSSSGLVVDTWNHVAMCCNGSDNIKMFMNGSKVYDGGYGPNAGQGIFTIGPSSWDGIRNVANTRFQDFRIYTGVQKYTQNFTVDMDNPDFGGRILG